MDTLEKPEEFADKRKPKAGLVTVGNPETMQTIRMGFVVPPSPTPTPSPTPPTPSPFTPVSPVGVFQQENLTNPNAEDDPEVTSTEEPPAEPPPAG